jgi:hypothetical protein
MNDNMPHALCMLEILNTYCSPLQHWLHASASVLHYTYCAFIVLITKRMYIKYVLSEILYCFLISIYYCSVHAALANMTSSRHTFIAYFYYYNTTKLVYYYYYYYCCCFRHNYCCCCFHI